MNAPDSLNSDVKKSDAKSKILINVSLILTIVFLLCIAEVVGSFITGKYLQLLLAFLITTCYILSPIVLFHNNIKLYTGLLLPIIFFVPAVASLIV